MNLKTAMQTIAGQEVQNLFAQLYGKENIADQQARYCKAIEAFSEIYPNRTDIRIYSASGRTEIGGNHTDHQRGVVLAGAVNLDTVGVVAFHDEGVVRVKSEGYDPVEVCLDALTPNPADSGTQALVRGVLCGFQQQGVTASGFDMYVISDVIRGGGISSSAAFEVLMGTVLNCQYNGGNADPFTIAKIGWYAENVFFGKKCGLMDQTASAFGGLVSVDFADSENPVVKQVAYDFEQAGYALCITDTKSSHEDLTEDYDAIRDEMKLVAECLGCEVLSQADEKEFYTKLPQLRQRCSDRALLRAIHFFNENRRAAQEALALEKGDVDGFLKLVNASGASSDSLLQNLYATKTPTQQAIPLAIALSKEVLQGRGAVRVHGGGFAGTIQAFVPFDKVLEYKAQMERVFGAGACYQMKIRPYGGIAVI